MPSTYLARQCLSLTSDGGLAGRPPEAGDAAFVLLLQTAFMALWVGPTIRKRHALRTLLVLGGCLALSVTVEANVAGATTPTTVPAGPTSSSDPGESAALDRSIIVVLGLLAVGGLTALLLLGLRRRRPAPDQLNETWPTGADRTVLDQWFSQARRTAQQARLLLQETEEWAECDSGSLSDRSLGNIEPRIDLLTAQLVDVMATAPVPEDGDLVRSVAICSQSLTDAVKSERRQRLLSGDRDDRGVSADALVPLWRRLDLAVRELETTLGLS